MNDYVDLPGSIVNGHPTNMLDTNLFGFLLKADYNKLQALSDQRYDAPSNGKVKYAPVSSYVFVTFTHTAKLQSTLPEYSKKGAFAGVDVTFWVLSARVKEKNNGELKAKSLAWFVPYIFVDTALSMAPGREIFGYPKTIGTFDFDWTNKNPESFSCSTYAMEKFAEDAMAKNVTLFDIKKTGEAEKHEDGLKEIWNDAKEAIGAVKEIIQEDEEIKFFNLSFIWNTAKDLLSNSFGMAFLKQFRSVEDGTKACYQAIQESDMKTLDFKKGGLLAGEYEMTFHSCDQFPIAETFGLKNDEPYKVTGVWANADLQLTEGKEIWNAEKKGILEMV